MEKIDINLMQFQLWSRNMLTERKRREVEEEEDEWKQQRDERTALRRILINLSFV